MGNILSCCKRDQDKNATDTAARHKKTDGLTPKDIVEEKPSKESQKLENTVAQNGGTDVSHDMEEKSRHPNDRSPDSEPGSCDLKEPEAIAPEPEPESRDQGEATPITTEVLANDVEQIKEVEDKNEQVNIEQNGEHLIETSKQDEQITNSKHNDVIQDDEQTYNIQDQPDINRDQDQPDINGDQDQPDINRDQDQPDINGDQDQPDINGDQDQPDINGDQDQPDINGDQDQPDINGDGIMNSESDCIENGNNEVDSVSSEKRWQFPPVLDEFDLMETETDPAELEAIFADERLREIYIGVTPEGTGLGISIVGGQGSPSGDLPIIIKRILPGSLAEKTDQLKSGDELIAMNDKILVGVPKDTAIDALSNLEGCIRLLVLQDD